jgi:hypothetical protein
LKVQSLIAQTIWYPGQDWQERARADVSVLLPTFCRAKSGLFERAVRSVLAQRNIYLELIIIDDGSVDGTSALINEFMLNDPRVSYLKHPVNIGLPAISEYEAYQYSRGDFIAFAFDDDEFLPDALAGLLAAALANAAKCVYGYVDIHLPDATTQQPAVIANFGRDGSPQMMLHSHNFISNNAVLVHRDVLENVGLYDPHIAIARLCDWDLWCRIAQSYDLVPVDVAVGRIDGPTRGESLGNTYGVELWLANEWMHLPRDEKLRPANFAQYDVLATPSSLSSEAASAVDAIANSFRSKAWYKSTSTEPSSASNRALGSIAVLVSSYDAAITLCFDRLPVSLRPRLRIMVYQQWQGTLPEELLGASAIIFARDLFGMADAIAYAQQLQIPHYYFLDDNFMASSKLPEYRGQYCAYSPQAVTATLQSFRGVLVTTVALQHYVLEEQLHHQVFVLPPIEFKELNNPVCNHLAAPAPRVKLAFLGVTHRFGAFVNTVVPALGAASKEQAIALYIAGDEKDVQILHLIDALAPYAATFSLVLTPFNSDLDSQLRYLRDQNVRVLLHPGEDHVNGKYKTLNVLLNAKQIGAVPILSAVEPYLGLAQLGVAYVVENTEAAWLSALQTCISSPQQLMLKNLNEFCAREFSGAANVLAMEQILASHPPVTVVVRDARYRLAMAAQKAVNRQLQAQLRSRRFVVKRALKMLWDAFLTKLKLR